MLLHWRGPRLFLTENFQIYTSLYMKLTCSYLLWGANACVCVYVHLCTHVLSMGASDTEQVKKRETSLIWFWNISIVAAHIKYTTQHFKRTLLSSLGSVTCVLWQWKHSNIVSVNILHITPLSKNDMVQLRLKKTVNSYCVNVIESVWHENSVNVRKC